MSTWAQVTPDGTTAVDGSLTWSEQIDMTVKDQNGDPVDMTGATYVVTSEQIAGITLAYDAGTQTVGLSLTSVQLDAYSGTSFRYYLQETTVLGAALLWRRVTVVRPV